MLYKNFFSCCLLLFSAAADSAKFSPLQDKLFDQFLFIRRRKVPKVTFESSHFFDSAIYFSIVSPITEPLKSKAAQRRKNPSFTAPLVNSNYAVSTLSACTTGVKLNPSGSRSTRIKSPSLKSPANICRASGSCSSRWMARLSGRAPKSGS